MDAATLLRVEIAAKGLRVNQVARAAQMQPQYLSRLLHGRIRPLHVTVERLRAAIIVAADEREQSA